MIYTPGESPKAGRSTTLFHRMRRKTALFASNRKTVAAFLIFVNVAMLATIATVALLGARADKVLSQGATTSTGSKTAQPLDLLSSADIAVNAAKITNLPETPGLVNQAQSVRADLAVAPADAAVVAKPQTVGTALPSAKDIKTYTTAEGDSVASVAAKFNVTSDSVMWSNNLTGNTLSAGTLLLIPPANGIVYSVQAGDTVDSLATKYMANKDQIIAVNDIEITGLQVGSRILIPNGQKPAPVVVSVYSVASAGTAVYGAYNGYDYGFCTWYAANRRAQLGRPVPSNLGNANTWTVLAASYGIPTGVTPQVGAVAVKRSAAPGHVGIVESVNADGSFWMSEMNSYGQKSMTDSTPTGGWGVVDWKFVSAGSVSGYTFVY